MNSKVVENYIWVEVKHGVFKLIFNTYERWIKFFQINDNYYCFEDSNCIEENIAITLPEQLNNGKFISAHMQEKDQIIFYFIPFDNLKGGKVILNEKNVITNE